MAEKVSEQSIIDKSMRSVFVGNIPYEATEERLKEIFSGVGQVLSLKLVYDRESGKPKGFGFCEFNDQETALSAMRNLNGYEIGGRTLRVDNACTEKSRMEMQQLLQGPQVDNPYGDPCDPEEAPEIITKTVASLPPEQMFELMKQMKQCATNNPAETRQMLMLNPQLSYALLQAMVVMRIVEPEDAAQMLFNRNAMPPVIPLGANVPAQPSGVAPMPLPQQQQQQPSQIPMAPLVQPMSIGHQMPPVGPVPNYGPPQTSDVDLRMMTSNINLDPRQLDPRAAMQQQRNQDLDLRTLPNPVPSPLIDARNRLPGPPMHAQFGGIDSANAFPVDPRQRPSDPRVRGNPASSTTTQQQQQQQAQLAAAQQQQQLHNRLASNYGLPSDASDQDKKKLIMQVLQLTDEQISQLPPQQRASILALKEQIAKSTQR